MQYLLESAVCLGIFYAFYRLFLQHETFFQWNRLYLLLTPAASFLIPALHIQLDPAGNSAEAASKLNLSQVLAQTQAAPQALQRGLEQPATLLSLRGITVGQILGTLYAAGAILLAIVLIVKLFRLIKFIRQCRRNRAGDYVLAVSETGETPVASFFSVVFWHKEDINEQERFILEHELVHARQWHSLDVLLMEAMVIWQWFNPLIYLYRRSLQVVHEYIADDFVVRSTRQRFEYARLLAQQYRDRARPDLLNTFHSQLKDRLMMLAKSPSRGSRRLKFALVLPLFAALMMLFSFRLIETLPLTAPISRAVKEADVYLRHLTEFTVHAGHDAVPPVTVEKEPSPYILYWGVLQFRFEKEGNRYFAETHASTDLLWEALKREPRLWTGTSLEQSLHFQVENQLVHSEYYDENVYFGCRKELEKVLTGVAPGGIVKLSKIPLPGGVFGSANIVLDGNSPNWLPKKQSETVWRSDPGKTDLETFNVLRWEDETADKYDRQFFTVSEFNSLIRKKAYIMDLIHEKKQAADNLAIAVISSPLSVGTRYEHVSRDGAVSFKWSELAEIFAEMAEQIRPGTTVYIDTYLPGSDTVFDMSGKIIQPSVQYNVKEIMRFDLVPENDPRLALKWTERRDYVFEWGDFATRFNNMYAVSFPAKPIDISPLVENIFKIQQNMGLSENPPVRFDTPSRFYADRTTRTENHMLTAKKILEMLELQPRLSRETRGRQSSVNGPEGARGGSKTGINPEGLQSFSFMLQFRERNEKIENGVVPADFKAFIKAELKPHDVIYLTDLQSGNIDLGAAYIRLEVNAESPKPALPQTAAPTEKSAQVIIQAPAPNPVGDHTAIRYSVPGACKANLFIVNSKGEIVWSQVQQINAGEQVIDLLKSDFKSGSGVYTLTVQTPFGAARQQITVAE